MKNELFPNLAALRKRKDFMTKLRLNITMSLDGYVAGLIKVARIRSARVVSSSMNGR